MTTPTITPHSGQSTDAFSRPSERDHGDPYGTLCSELLALLTRKRGYYGCPEEGPLDNAMGVQEQGISPWLYQLARIGEKVRRCGGLSRGTLDRQRVQQIRKTLLDIAGHAVVAVAVLEKQSEEL